MKLKPCPFCGADGIDVVIDARVTLVHKRGKWVQGKPWDFKVVCNPCGATSTVRWTKREAISSWNMRHAGKGE